MKTMRVSILAMAFVGVTGAAMAQSEKKSEGRKAPSQEEMVGKRADHLAAELGLDDAQAAKFKDIYARHAKGAMAARQQAGKDRESGQKAKRELTDGDVDAQMKAQLERRLKSAQDESNYYNELRTVLSARQAKRVMEQQPMQRGMMHQPMQRGMMRQPMQHMQQGPKRQSMQRGMMHQPMQRGMRPGFSQPRQGMKWQRFQGMPQQHKGMSMPQMSKQDMKKLQEKAENAKKEREKADKKKAKTTKKAKK